MVFPTNFGTLRAEVSMSFFLIHKNQFNLMTLFFKWCFQLKLQLIIWAGLSHINWCKFYHHCELVFFVQRILSGYDAEQQHSIFSYLSVGSILYVERFKFLNLKSNQIQNIQIVTQLTFQLNVKNLWQLQFVVETINFMIQSVAIYAFLFI